MPNESLSEALKEVYALSPNDRITIDTITLSHSALESPLYMAQDRVEWDLTLEDGETHTFEPIPFRFIPPTTGENGLQEMSIAIDNIDRRVMDFIDTIGTDSDEAVEVTYRPYLSSDTSAPQMSPPLVLFLTDIVITAFEVTGRASFTNIVNASYLTEYYDRQRFAGLS